MAVEDAVGTALLVAESDVGRLLGKKGAKIEQLRADSRAQLKLLSPAESHKLVAALRGEAKESMRVLRIAAPDKATVARACALVRAVVLVPPTQLASDSM